MRQKKQTPTGSRQPNIDNSPRIITGVEALNHCAETGGRELMCKNCDSVFAAVLVPKNYCNLCAYWVCPKCEGELCGECKTIFQKLKK